MYNPPRLVWEFVRSAGERGAVAANYCEVTGLLREGDRVTGVRATDRLGGGQLDVRARTVVNASGPFAEQIYLNQGLRRERRIPLSRDMAVVIGKPLVTGRALAAQTKYRDPDAVLSRGNRHVFLVPWRNRTLIGVNSRVWPGDPYALEVTEAEVAGFVDEIRSAAPQFGITLDDVAMVYAGLLPFGQNDAGAVDLSFGKRSHLIDHEAADGVEGLVSAISIRFTTARGLAEQATNLVFGNWATGTAPVPDPGHAPAWRAVRPLHGAGAEHRGGPGRRPRRWGRRSPGAQSRECLRRRPARGRYHAPRPRAHRRHRLPPGRSGPCSARRDGAHAARLRLPPYRPWHRGDPGDPALDETADLMAAELGWAPERRARELAEVRARYPGWTVA